MPKKICAVLLLLILALPVVVNAADVKDINSVPALKKFVTSSGANITYVGRRHSVDMWVAVKDDTMQVIYTTPDGQGMLTNGMLFGPDGKMATEDMITEFGEKNPAALDSLSKSINMVDDVVPVGEVADLVDPQSADKTNVADIAREMKPSERLWQALGDAQLISFGKSTAPIIYAFVDPRCGHCDDFWHKIAPVYVAKGQVSLRLIPVGLLGPESVELAARVLGAKDPSQAWLDLKAGKELGTGEITPDGQIAVAQNGDLMSKWKIQSTPFLVYRNPAGVVRLLRGSPENLDTLLLDMGLKTPASAKN